MAPPWMGPPENELGEPVPAELFLVRTHRLVIAITELLVYSTGFEFRAAVRMPSADRQELLDRAPKRVKPPPDESPPADVLQFSVTFADGRQGRSLTTPLSAKLARAWQAFATVGKTPDGVVVFPRGGWGNGPTSSAEYWVWPLPVPGMITFACQWPLAGVQLTTQQLDTSPVLRAADRVEPLWPS
jgi:hypothetical protein